MHLVGQGLWGPIAVVHQGRIHNPMGKYLLPSFFPFLSNKVIWYLFFSSEKTIVRWMYVLGLTRMNRKSGKASSAQISKIVFFNNYWGYCSVTCSFQNMDVSHNAGCKPTECQSLMHNAVIETVLPLQNMEVQCLLWFEPFGIKRLKVFKRTAFLCYM